MSSTRNGVRARLAGSLRDLRFLIVAMLVTLRG